MYPWFSKIEESQIIAPDRLEYLKRITSGRIYSLFYELKALLLVGSMAMVSGLGILIYKNMDTIGHNVLLACLVIGTLICFSFMVVRGAPFSRYQSDSKGALYDAVLFLGCLLFGICVNYTEFRFHVFPNGQRDAFLPTVLVGGLIAYRYDHRGALGLALSAGLAWLGIRLNWDEIGTIYRNKSLVSTGVWTSVGVVGIGTLTRFTNFRPHFLTYYLHYAMILALASLVTGMVTDKRQLIGYTLLLAGFGVASLIFGLRRHSPAFIAYASLYLYISLSVIVCRELDHAFTISLYFLLSSIAFVFIFLKLRRNK